MQVEKLAVLGAGTMGCGIAQSAAASGFSVTLYDVDRQALEKAFASVKNNVGNHLVAKGKVSEQEGAAILARLSTETDLVRAVCDTDFVIEAVPENMGLKRDIFARLDQICPSQTILATNTSVMSVTAISGATTRPDRCIGTHFFNPAAVMKLVEIVIPLEVARETIDTTLAVCRKMGKTPIKVKDTPGFIVNRLLMGLYMEAAQMVLEGTATAEDIDAAMRLGAGHPMGPCELADFGGFDVIQMASDEVFAYTHRESDRLNILYRKMLEAGRLGKKNGRGFYDYRPDGTKKPYKLFS